MKTWPECLLIFFSVALILGLKYHVVRKLSFNQFFYGLTQTCLHRQISKHCLTISYIPFQDIKFLSHCEDIEVDE